jgi:hypothetical protein
MALDRVAGADVRVKSCAAAAAARALSTSNRPGVRLTVRSETRRGVDDGRRRGDLSARRTAGYPDGMLE